MDLTQTFEPTKAQIHAVSEAQEEPRYEAHLRRIGRGRKHGFVLSPYLTEHERIFGKTNIFRNIAKEAEKNHERKSLR